MSFYIQSVEIGGPRPFYLLGPCSLECESFVWEMARSIKSIAENLDIPLIFKASYDKANRTSITSFRGPGVREGCRILSEIGKELELPVVTDVHTAGKRRLPLNTWTCSRFPPSCAARQIFWKPAPRAAVP